MGNPLPNIVVTDFPLRVEKVIRDDGGIAAGKSIILRMIGAAEPGTKGLTENIEFPFSYPGDRYLFLLTPNRDGKTYGLRYGPWSRLIVDGEILRTSRGKQQPLQFEGTDQPVTLDEFVQFVESLSGSDFPTPIPDAGISPLAVPDT